MQLDVKYCGFTSLVDALAAGGIGVPYIGFIFAPGSRRALVLTEETRRWILEFENSYPKVQKMAVTAQTDAVSLQTLLSWNLFQGIQFADAPEAITKLIPLLPAHTKLWISINLTHVEQAVRQKESWDQVGVDAFVVDSLDQNYYGGTGKINQADPRKGNFLGLLQEQFPLTKRYLAGGLNAQNIVELWQAWNAVWQRPGIPFHGVDVAGGIEAPGSMPPRKDLVQMEAFWRAVQKLKG